MPDPRSMTLDGPTRPWEQVTPVSFCSACLGTLPPDSYAACSTCGGGIQPPRTSIVLDEERVTTHEEMATLPRLALRAGEQRLVWPEPPVRTSWATWPNPPEPDSLSSTSGAGWGTADVGSAWTVPRLGTDFAQMRPGDRFTVETPLPPPPGTRAIVHMPDGSTVEAVVAEPSPPWLRANMPTTGSTIEALLLPRRSWWRRIWRRRRG